MTKNYFDSNMGRCTAWLDNWNLCNKSIRPSTAEMKERRVSSYLLWRVSIITATLSTASVAWAAFAITSPQLTSIIIRVVTTANIHCATIALPANQYITLGSLQGLYTGQSGLRRGHSLPIRWREWLLASGIKGGHVSWWHEGSRQQIYFLIDTRRSVAVLLSGSPSLHRYWWNNSIPVKTMTCSALLHLLLET